MHCCEGERKKEKKINKGSKQNRLINDNKVENN